MKLYIASCDMFFLLGLRSFLSNEGCEVVTINLSDPIPVNIFDELNYSSAILFDFDCKGFNSNADEFYRKLRWQGLSIIPIIEIPRAQDGQHISEVIFISKSARLSCVLPIVHQLIGKRLYAIKTFTNNELYVINEFINGVKPCNVSRRISRSVKTVSSHKRNAMRKMGLRSFNVATLLWLKGELITTYLLG